jgi:hypothetical protein
MGKGDEHPGRPWAAWTAEAIDRHDRDLLASFAERAVLDVDGLGPTLFCRGSPRDDEELLTALSRSAAGAQRSRASFGRGRKSKEGGRAARRTSAPSGSELLVASSICQIAW